MSYSFGQRIVETPQKIFAIFSYDKGLLLVVEQNNVTGITTAYEMWGCDFGPLNDAAVCFIL